MLSDRLSAPRIAVLGPIAVGHDGALHRVSGRPGRLLVGLAVGTRAHSFDHLAEVVWGEQPPATYRSALHVHLGTLRRLLAERAPSCQIVRIDSAYSLELGSVELDARLAADLFAAAADELEAAPASALALVEHALRLFRGTPYTADGHVVDEPSRHQLEALQRDAEELRVEAMLRAGQCARAESVALAGVDAEPLRERRWGQLLRAQYLEGRTADALATYQRARTTLIDAIGLEPGRELRDLEAAALTHDVERLRLPREVEESIVEVPQRLGTLVGRDVEIRRLTSWAATGRPMVLLGPPGVGKSRLAIELAHLLATEGVAWINLRSAAREAVPELVRDVSDWARRHPEGLVVIDDADVAVADVQAAVSDLSRRVPRIRVLVTSRTPLSGDFAVEIIGPLALPHPDDDDEAIEAAPAVILLRDALRELAPASELPASAAALIARRAGGLPLVLRLRAAAARALSPDMIIEQPASIEGDATDLAVGMVVGSLDDATARAFAELSLLSSDFDAHLGALVTALPLDRFASVVVDLVDHGLVQASPDRLLPYGLLEPIRVIGRRMLDAFGATSLVQDRHTDACLARAAGMHAVASDAGAPDLAVRLASDLAEHRLALDRCARVGDSERALTLVCRLERPLYALGWWPEKMELFDVALAIAGPPTAMRARAHAFRARSGPMHLFDLGHAECAEEMGDVLGEDRIVAYAKHLRSIGLWWLGEPERAVELAAEASETLATAGRTLEANEARKFLGVALLFAGDADQGLRIQQEVLADVRASGNAFNIAHNLAYLGHCHRRVGDDTAALADWNEARELCRQLSNRGTAIHVTIGLAEVAVDRGDADLSLERTSEALGLADAARTSIYEPWAWTVALRSHRLSGDAAAATACARRAIRALPQAPSGETVRLAVELAHLAAALGDFTTAARLVGVAEATPDLRELPFPSPVEAERRAALEETIAVELGDRARDHTEAGRRCSVAEAATELLGA